MRASEFKSAASLGLVMIVKNEETFVSQAIQSAKSLCRQLVVIDTGSTDNTPLICTGLGADVYFHEWNNDFSETRNHALSYLRTDWALVLDADEILDINSFLNDPAISSMINKDENSGQIGGLNVKIRNYLERGDGKSVSTHSFTRLFRTDKNIRFSGSIHEQIRPSIENAGYIVVDTSIVIGHYGYRGISPEKISRNREMLNREIEKNPNDDWLKYHLGETEFSSGNHSKAFMILGSVYDSPQLSDLQKEKSRIRLAQISLSEDDYTRVEELLDFESRDIEIEGFRQFILATALMANKRYQEAKELYESNVVTLSGLVDKEKLAEALKVLMMVSPGRQ